MQGLKTEGEDISSCT